MNDTLTVTKEIAHAIGVTTAPVALTTGNHAASVITVISSVIILLPKVIDLIAGIRNIFKKRKNVQS